MSSTVALGVPTGRALPPPIAAAFDALRSVREPLGRRPGPPPSTPPSRGAEGIHEAALAQPLRRTPCLERRRGPRSAAD